MKQAKERARLNATRPGTGVDIYKSPDIAKIEDADCLVEMSGAVLFDGDLVTEVKSSSSVLAHGRISKNTQNMCFVFCDLI
jgi:hypothetical protein